MSMNLFLGVGNLTRDPEVKKVGEKNVSLATFTLAISNKFKNNAGELKEETQFVPCEAWDSGADMMEKALHKGDEVFIKGQWRNDDWEDKDGNKRRSTKIVVREFQRLRQAGRKEESSSNVQEGVTTNATQEGSDIPF